MKLTVSLSVIIPVWNEAESIPALAREIEQVFTDCGFGWEAVWVDDGSVDGTRNSLSGLVAPHRFITLEPHSGKSAAYAAGVRATASPWIATIDGDGQNVPGDILTLFRHATNNHADVVVGIRSTRQDSPAKKASSRLGNLVRRVFLRDRFLDIGCGLRVGCRESFDCLPLFEGMHRFMPVFMERHGYLVVQQPVRHRARQGGISKYGVFNRFPASFIDLLGVWWLLRRHRRWKVAATDAPLRSLALCPVLPVAPPSSPASHPEPSR